MITFFILSLQRLKNFKDCIIIFNCMFKFKQYNLCVAFISKTNKTFANLFKKIKTIKAMHDEFYSPLLTTN